MEDAEFIVGLRTDPLRARFLHVTSPSIDDQRAWTERYFQREGDWYFVVEDLEGNAQGCVAIYNHNARSRRSEWGRWILRDGSLAALESAALVYEIGFARLGLESMYTHTESANLPVISFHTSMGSTTNGLVTGPEGEDWTEQEMTNSKWTELRNDIHSRVRMAARFATR